jgi:hypothetical protein
VCAALAHAAIARAAGDIAARADLTYGMDEALGASNTYFRQAYFLQWRRQMTDTLALRLSLRYQDDQGTLKMGGGEFPLHTWQLAPTAYLDYRLDDFSLVLGWDRNDSETLDSETTRWYSRNFQRFAASLRYTTRPFDAWAYANRITNTSLGLDTTDTRGGIGFLWKPDGFRLQNDYRAGAFENLVAGLSRTTFSPRLSLQYSKNAGEAYSFSGRYDVEYYWTRQEQVGAGPTEIPSEVQPVAGLYAVNPIPIDSAAVPMLPAPPLIDGVVEVSAGYSLGPDGFSFQNFGVDMGRVTTLDQLRLLLRQGQGQPVPFGGPVSWTAYVSQDGTRWVQVDGARGAFDLGLSAYVVSFPPSAARYFKVVNFGVNTVETFVTEVQTFVLSTVRPGQTQENQTLRQTLALAGHWRPWQPLQLLYAGQFDTNMLSRSGRASEWLTDLNNTLGLKLGSFSGFTFGLTGTMVRSTLPLGYVQASYMAVGYVSYQPFDRLEARVEGRYATDRAGPAETNTPAAGFSVVALPYDSMRFTGSATWSQQRIVGGGTTDFVTGSAMADVFLLRELELRFDLTMQNTVRSMGDVSLQEQVPLFRVIDYMRAAVSLRWRPSDQLDLIASVGYSSSSQASGLTQGYVARWYPFPGGTVHLDFEYREEVDPLSGRSYRQVTAMPRWDVNRYLRLQLGYNMIQGTGSVPMWQQSLYGMLSLFI